MGYARTVVRANIYSGKLPLTPLGHHLNCSEHKGQLLSVTSGICECHMPWMLTTLVLEPLDLFNNGE